MIAGVLLAASNVYMLGLLTWRQEYLLLQLIMLTQLWIGLALIPFLIRGEADFSARANTYAALGASALVAALFAGLAFGVESFWTEQSGFATGTKALLGSYSELLPVAGTSFIVAVLVVSGFLRGRT